MIDFGDKNRVISTTFNFMILKFSEIFDPPFSHVFIFGNMLPESHAGRNVEQFRLPSLIR